MTYFNDDQRCSHPFCHILIQGNILKHTEPKALNCLNHSRHFSNMPYLLIGGVLSNGRKSHWKFAKTCCIKFLPFIFLGFVLQVKRFGKSVLLFQPNLPFLPLKLVQPSPAPPATSIEYTCWPKCPVDPEKLWICCSWGLTQIRLLRFDLLLSLKK